MLEQQRSSFSNITIQAVFGRCVLTVYSCLKTKYSEWVVIGMFVPTPHVYLYNQNSRYQTM